MIRTIQVFLPLSWEEGGEVSGDSLGAILGEITARFGVVDFGVADQFTAAAPPGAWRNEGMPHRDHLAVLSFRALNLSSDKKWLDQFKEHWRKQGLQVHWKFCD